MKRKLQRVAVEAKEHNQEASDVKAQKRYKAEVEAIWQRNDLNILLANNQSFAEYDRARLMTDLQPRTEQTQRKPVKKFNWRKKDFDQNALISAVNAMKGQKVTTHLFS